VAPGGGLLLCQEEVTSEEEAADAAVARAVKVGTLLQGNILPLL
jgi:hypothetical protein